MTKAEEKKLARAAARETLETLSERYRARADAAIAAQLTALPEYRAADTVFCFVGCGREIDTRPLLTDALARGKRLCVPLCTEPGKMEPREITALSDLTPGAYGILEPGEDSPRVQADEIDFTVVPCLACDCAGRRLGRGGGYYDRFLALYRAAAVLVCRERSLRPELPVEPHDRPVPWVLTERGLYEDGFPARIE
jgi:5-formyltetrahydrofolate cyclo-ligase